MGIGHSENGPVNETLGKEWQTATLKINKNGKGIQKLPLQAIFLKDPPINSFKI